MDDPVLAKNYSARIELGRRQDRGKAKAVLKGIGGVTCVYGNPGRDQCWVMDSRMDDPAGDGHRKLDHVPERLTTGVYQTALPFPAVLRDTWDATKDWMLFLESVQPHYDGPLKDNRPVEDAGGQRPYPRVESRVWNEAALAPGQRIKIKGFPKDHKVPLFRVALATHRTEWIVTTDRTQHSTVATQPACRSRWKLEPWHREGQHVTGLERGQCRNARIQRNHIGGA